MVFLLFFKNLKILYTTQPAKPKTNHNKPAAANNTQFDGSKPTGVVRGRQRRESVLPAKFRDGAFSAQIKKRQAPSVSFDIKKI